MNKNSKAIILICGGVAVFVTVLFYLLTFKNIFTLPIRWVSLLMLIIAEIIGTVKAFNMKNSIFGVSSITTSLIHIFVVLVTSVIFVNFMPIFIKAYILVNVLFWAILLVVDVILQLFGNHVYHNDRKLYESQEMVNMCYKKAREICIEYGDTEYRNDLYKISEMLKYSDNSEMDDNDFEILNSLEDLSKLFEESQKCETLEPESEEESTTNLESKSEEEPKDDLASESEEKSEDNLETESEESKTDLEDELDEEYKDDLEPESEDNIELDEKSNKEEQSNSKVIFDKRDIDNKIIEIKKMLQLRSIRIASKKRGKY